MNGCAVRKLTDLRAGSPPIDHWLLATIPKGRRNQHDNGWPSQNPAGPENRVAGGWHGEDRADTPDEGTGMHGCEEKLLSGVPAPRSAGARADSWMASFHGPRARRA